MGDFLKVKLVAHEVPVEWKGKAEVKQFSFKELYFTLNNY